MLYYDSLSKKVVAYVQLSELTGTGRADLLMDLLNELKLPERFNNEIDREVLQRFFEMLHEQIDVVWEGKIIRRELDD